MGPSLCRAMRQAHTESYSTRLELRYRDLLLSLPLTTCVTTKTPSAQHASEIKTWYSFQCTVLQRPAGCGAEHNLTTLNPFTWATGASSNRNSIHQAEDTRGKIFASYSLLLALSAFAHLSFYVFPQRREIRVHIGLKHFAYRHTGAKQPKPEENKVPPPAMGWELIQILPSADFWLSRAQEAGTGSWQPPPPPLREQLESCPAESSFLCFLLFLLFKS